MEFSEHKLEGLRWTVTVEIEVEADTQEEAWELVATPFHNGVIRNDQPHWKNPLVNQPDIVIKSLNEAIDRRQAKRQLTNLPS